MSSPNTAKFTFLYLLSLVGLGFFAISGGIVIFQIINKHIVDVVEAYSTGYNSDALRFALASLIVAAPIYLATVRQLQKDLFSGALPAESAIRKWLTYLIVLIAAFVMIGWGIGVIYNFLNGELTFKFILKALTVLVIAGGIFHYYLHDIKREKIEGQADSLSRMYGYGAIVLAIVIFITGIVFVESPAEARRLRIDRETVNRLSQVESAMQQYYDRKDALPESLAQLRATIPFLTDDSIINPATQQEFSYRSLEGQSYELCAEFQTASPDKNTNEYSYYYGYAESSWEHEPGRACFERTALMDNQKPVPVR